MHTLWLLCEKAWSTLDIQRGTKERLDYGNHPKYGRVMSLVLTSPEAKSMFVLGLEREGVIIFFDPRAYGHPATNIVDGGTPDQVRAFLKKYTKVS